MSFPGLESFAQAAVGRVLNSLPESLLIVFGAGLLLRLIGRRSSGTRFAVWMVAFVAVALLPLVGGSAAGSGLVPAAHLHPEITLSSSWAIGLFSIWAAVSLLAMGRVIAGVVRVRAIRKNCAEIRLEDLDPILRETLDLHAAGRPVRLAVSEEVRVPTAIGFRSPAVILPRWVLRDVPPEQLRPILIHELAHLARRDDWTNLLQKTIRAVLFLHPAVWWIDAKLSTERELACDDAVLVATEDPRAYASSLLGLLERSGFRRGWTMAQAAVGRAREASQRIRRILSGSSPATTRVSRSALGLAAMLSAACCALLLAAPRLVAFGPAASESTAASTQALAIPRMEPRSFHRAPSVVAASWHPAEKPARNLVVRTVLRTALKKHPMVSSPRKLAVKQPYEFQPKTQAPVVQLASAAVPDPAQSLMHSSGPMRVMLVFETNSAPAASAANAPPVNSQSCAPAASPARPVTQIQTVQFQTVQFQTVEFVEQDANGVHIRTINLLFVLPAQSMEPGSISQSI